MAVSSPSMASSPASPLIVSAPSPPRSSTSAALEPKSSSLPAPPSKSTGIDTRPIGPMIPPSSNESVSMPSKPSASMTSTRSPATWRSHVTTVEGSPHGVVAVAATAIVDGLRNVTDSSAGNGAGCGIATALTVRVSAPEPPVQTSRVPDTESVPLASAVAAGTAQAAATRTAIRAG